MDISRSRYLRKELKAERISMGELAEIEEAFAGVPDEHLRDVRANAMAEDMLDEIDAHRERTNPPRVYTVSVDSEGFSADYNDLLVVAAENEHVAKILAEEWVRENHGYDTISVDSDRTEVYEYKGKARVLGTLATD